jgi:hypothetical protein
MNLSLDQVMNNSFHEQGDEEGERLRRWRRSLMMSSIKGQRRDGIDS